MMTESKSYPLDIFLERYVSFTDDLMKMEKKIEKLNRIYARENFCVNEHGNLMIKNDESQRICNFFVWPTHKLYYDHGNFLELEGVAVIVYTKHEDEYKRVYLNLTNDLIENGNWVRSESLDTEYDLIKSSQYFYVRSALKVATRRIDSDDVKIFDGENWIEDEEASDLMDEYHDYLKARRIWGNVKNSIGKDLSISDYLKAVMVYVKESQLTEHGMQPFDEETNKGWESNESYFLWGKEFWKWIESRFENDELSFDKDGFIKYLIEEELIKVETEKTGRQRTEVWETVYPKFKKRFLTFDKAKLQLLLEK